MGAVTSKKVKRTDEFDLWLDGLLDEIGKAAINERIDRLKGGNVGDVKPVKGAQGLYEIRVDVGPGYRVYFVVVGNTIILLLLGGDKSTQKGDIKRAKRMLDDMKECAAAAKKKREEEERKAVTAAEKARQSHKSKRK